MWGGTVRSIPGAHSLVRPAELVSAMWKQETLSPKPHWMAPMQQHARLTSGLHVHPINSPYTRTEAVTTESPGSLGSFLQGLNLLGSSEMELLFLVLLDTLLELHIKLSTSGESWNVLFMLRFFLNLHPGTASPLLKSCVLGFWKGLWFNCENPQLPSADSRVDLSNLTWSNWCPGAWYWPLRRLTSRHGDRAGSCCPVSHRLQASLVPSHLELISQG